MTEDSGEDKDLLPFTSGRIVKDYRLLKTYWQIAREKRREDLIEKAMLSEKDYKRIQDIVSEKGRISLADLWDLVASEAEERIDPETAAEAARRAGINTDPSTARRLVAKQLAAWMIEAAEHWRFISTREDVDRS